MKIIFACLAALPMLLLSGCVDSKTVSFESLSNFELNTFSSQYDFHRQLDKMDVCANSKKKLVPAANYNALLAKVNKLNEISNSEARRADRFISQSSWAESIDESIYQSRGSSYSEYITRATAKWLRSQITKFQDSEGRTIAEEEADSAASFINEEVVEDTVRYCKLNTKYSDGYADLAERYNNLLADVETLAEQVPWYPEGWREWPEDPTLAWTSVGGCSTYADACAAIKVATIAGCSSIYAEINWLGTGGGVVGWTNDTAGTLRAGQSAILNFTGYSDYTIKQYEVTKINCH